MDLRLTEEQEMLRKTARDFLSTELQKRRVREIEENETGHSPDIWRQMGELGWLGLVIPETFGGMGLGFQDLAVLLQELGRQLLPGPFLGTAVCSLAILDWGSNRQKEELLPKIAQGEMPMAVALLESAGTIGPSGMALGARDTGSNYLVNGSKLFVEMAHVAESMICVVRTRAGGSPEAGVTVLVTEAASSGIACEIMPTLAVNKLCEVRFKEVTVPKENVLGQPDEGWPVVEGLLRKAVLAKCAESLGAMQACVDMTVAYSKERVQYGRPIGAFQALQHIMADMWIAAKTSECLTQEAIWMESQMIPCSKEASMAKAYVNESFKKVSKWAIRLHGGVGTSAEHDVSLYYRAAKAADVLFGDTGYHRGLVAEKTGLYTAHN